MLRFLLWLVVLLTPPTGLIAGFVLMPPPLPRWNFDSPTGKKISCLGYLADGRTILLKEWPGDAFGGSASVYPEAVLGVDLQSGKQIFRLTGPGDFTGTRMDRINFSSDRTHLAFMRNVLSDPNNPSYEIAFYDCIAHRITRKVKSWARDGDPSSQILAGSTAVANGGGTKLLVWKDQSEWPTRFDLGYIANPELSSDGKFIIIRKLGSDARLELFDVASLEKVLSIPGYFEAVLWSADHRGFLAIENLKFVKIVAKRFEKQEDNTFAMVPGSELILKSVGWLRNDNPFLTVKCHRGRDAWGANLLNWTGDRLKFLIDRLWPVESAVQIHDGHTGRLLHRMNIPKEGEFGTPSTHPSGLSVAVWDSKTLSLWEVYPATRWYPRIGFMAGILLSVLLGWRLIKTGKRREPIT